MPGHRLYPCGYKRLKTNWKSRLCQERRLRSRINTTKNKFSTSTLLSGVLRRRDVSWRCIGAANSRYEWVEQKLGFTFVDPNRWVDDWDIGRDGLHIN